MPAGPINVVSTLPSKADIYSAAISLRSKRFSISTRVSVASLVGSGGAGLRSK